MHCKCLHLNTVSFFCLVSYPALLIHLSQSLQIPAEFPCEQWIISQVCAVSEKSSKVYPGYSYPAAEEGNREVRLVFFPRRVSNMIYIDLGQEISVTLTKLSTSLSRAVSSIRQDSDGDRFQKIGIRRGVVNGIV